VDPTCATAFSPRGAVLCELNRPEEALVICERAIELAHWLLQADVSPWCPGHRLFREERAGDWDGVFERIRAELLTQMLRVELARQGADGAGSGRGTVLHGFRRLFLRSPVSMRYNRAGHCQGPWQNPGGRHRPDNVVGEIPHTR
jgi:hypothetical protein